MFKKLISFYCLHAKMSSPYNSLKKNKVPLFPGHMSGNRPIPFRLPDYSEDENRLLEEITTSMAQDRLKKHKYLPQLTSSTSPPLLKISETSRSDVLTDRRLLDSAMPPSNSELMRLMMNKLTLLEQKTKAQETELKNKDRQIHILEDKLKIMEKACKDNTNTNSMKDLETHCLLLQQQVHEMETFLAEYGMVWVGENGNSISNVYLPESVDDEDDENITNTSIRSYSPDNSIASSNPFGIWRQDVSLPSSQAPFNIDFNLLIENIKDLNVLAGEGVAQIKKTADGARFTVPEPIQLTIYANGILMFDGPFRPYSDSKTRQCVQDLLDGYFPSELQQRYPDGVPFVITDLRGTHFQPKASPVIFSGEGQMLGGEIKPSRLIRTHRRDSSNKLQVPSPRTSAISSDEKQVTTITTKLPRKPLTQSQFINKLPKSVIKDGKVIEIRDSVAKTLMGQDSSVKPVITLDNMDAQAHPSAEGPPTGPHSQNSKYTTLRILTENGEQTLIVKMRFDETIGDLRKYLDKHRPPKVPYDIISTFPNKIHKNNTLTLEASDLTPNAVLHLKPHKMY
ncbi:UBX domain-containing protein 11 [Bulinus truncatus]|nr:UBX domain-containing protein 11 [Bulinus truncatus]